MTTLFTDEVPVVSTGILPWELGIKISFSAPGHITAIRFWKLPDDIGPHVGHLWMPDGPNLSVLFLDEGADGWQTQTIPPQAVSAGAVVTVSVASLGHYPVEVNGVLASVVTDSLSCRAIGAVYGSVVGRKPILPSPNNYFRDVVFTPVGTFCAVACPE